MLLIELATQLMSHTTRLLSPYSQSYDQNLDRLTVTDLKTLEMSKLDNLMTLPSGLAVILLPLLLLLILTLVQDQRAKSHLLSTLAFDQDYELMQADFQGQADDLQGQLKEAQSKGDHEQAQMFTAVLASNQAALDYVNDLYQPLKERRTAFEAGDGQAYYQTFDTELAIWFNPNNRFGMEDESYWMPRFNYYQAGDFPSLYGFHVSQDRLKELADRQIRPLAGAGINLTPYDRALSKANQAQDSVSYQLADQSALGLLYRFFRVYRLDIILILVALFFAGGGYSLEGDAGDSLDWLYSLPLKRQDLHRAKYWASRQRSGHYLLLVLALVAFVGLVLDGVGQWSLPVIDYQHQLTDSNQLSNFESSYQWMDLGEYILKVIVMLLVAVSFVLTLSLLLSHWLTNTWVLYGATLLLCIGGYLFSSRVTWGHYLPFLYLNVAQAVDGSIIFHLKTNRPNYLQGLIVLAVSSLILYGLSLVLVQVRKGGGLKCKS